MTSGERFLDTFKALIEAIRTSFDPDPTLAGLILLYASMDMISSLTRPLTQDDTCKKIFKGWVDDYMLPNSGLKCNASDIYAARCGVLHTLSTSSQHSRSNKARRLEYVDNPTQVQRCQQSVDSTETNIVVVPLPMLLNAFYRGIIRFAEAAQQDEDLLARVSHHFKSVLAIGSFRTPR
jgi:hypothetical protein